MAKRARLVAADDTTVTANTFTSGCVLLDCVLGGGWAEKRIINVVGDKSTGKTLLAIEACANFRLKYPKGIIRYNEVESAFDIPYASRLGLPADSVQFVDDCYTVEDLYEDLEQVLERKGKQPVLYVLDSLDALSDRTEEDSAIDKGTYGAKKAAQISKLFRKLNKLLNNSNVTVLIVSQIRDKIGVTFGKTSQRSGGKALDFYASQVVWLTHTKRLYKQRKGIKRCVGVNIKAVCEKNKVGMPFRECEFPIIFMYGVDDVPAALEWLKTVKLLKLVGVTSDKQYKALLRDLDTCTQAKHTAFRTKLAKQVQRAWAAVEKKFAPARSKYATD